MLHHIKVNLPETEEEYIDGNGEGVWVLVDDDTYNRYQLDDFDAGTYVGILDNDSVYYPHMVHGMAVVIEMRGDHRPVVPWLFLVDYERFLRSEMK